MSIQTLKIDLISDVICPWCVIGYKRLEKALALTGNVNAEIHWHPFELNPDTPKGGENFSQRLMAVYGFSEQDCLNAQNHVTSLTAELGFEFNYSAQSRTYNTRDAHKLIQWSATFNKQTELHLRLFRAHFTEQQAIDDHQVLLTLAGEVGLPTNQAAAVLNDPGQDALIATRENDWLKAGVRGVPTFIFNKTTVIRGAQDITTLVNTINIHLQRTA